MGKKVTHTFFSAPILKHQTFFLQELTQNERIQPVPVDLGNLCHIVPIYLTARAVTINAEALAISAEAVNIRAEELTISAEEYNY